MGFKGSKVVTGDIMLNKIKALKDLPEFSEQELKYILNIIAQSKINVSEIELAYSAILKFQQLILYYRKLDGLKK